MLYTVYYFINIYTYMLYTVYYINIYILCVICCILLIYIIIYIISQVLLLQYISKITIVKLRLYNCL